MTLRHRPREATTTTTSPPSDTSIHARFRGWQLFATTTTTTTLGHEHVRSFSRVVAVCHHHHLHLPTLGHERTRSFSRVAAVCHHHHPRTRARTLVFEGV